MEQFAIEASAVEEVEQQMVEDDPRGAEVTVTTLEAEGGKLRATRSLFTTDAGKQNYDG